MDTNEKKPRRPRIGQAREINLEDTRNEGAAMAPRTERPSGEYKTYDRDNTYEQRYQPRRSYNNNYNREGGYQPRQQGGGYGNRYNNNYNRQGGYQRRDYGSTTAGDNASQPLTDAEGTVQTERTAGEGGYQPRQQGGYNNRQGGYNKNYNRQGGYNNYNRQGGYNNNYNRQGGYNNRQGGYNNKRQGGYMSRIDI